MLQASLMSSHGVDLEPVSEWRFPNDKPAYQVSRGCTVRLSDTANVPAALERLEGAMMTPDREQVEEWLAAVQIATAGAKRSEASQAIALEIYASALGEFPADVVHTACVRIATTSKWFPVLAEIVELCEKLVTPRREMLRALRKHSA